MSKNEVHDIQKLMFRNGPTAHADCAAVLALCVSSPVCIPSLLHVIGSDPQPFTALHGRWLSCFGGLYSL